MKSPGAHLKKEMDVLRTRQLGSMSKGMEENKIDKNIIRTQRNKVNQK